jgi:nicotinate-nucleotide adenylyltransferase
MRIGIFGGTFDPPHIGHLVLAADAIDQMKLDSLLWVLTPNPPHKIGQVITDPGIRTEMVKAMIVRFPEFVFSDLEFRRPGPHFAVDTMREFHKLYPDAQLFYLLGADSLNDLPAWHDPAGFVSQCDGIIFMQREGESPDWNSLDQSLPDLHAITYLLKTPRIEISSHEIRERVKQNHSWRPFVNDGVEKIIKNKNLYR